MEKFIRLSCWSHHSLIRVGKAALDAPRLVHGWSRVSRRRIVAVQTVVVTVLAVVVFLTLLQTEGGEMPSGLEAPAQQGADGANANAEVRSDYVSHRSGQGGHATREGDGRRTPNARPPASTGALGPVPPLGDAALPGKGYPGDDDSPTSDQYADTLTRLSDDLR